MRNLKNNAVSFRIQVLDKRWIMVFSLWILLLSGILANFLGTPGIIQAVGLNNLLKIKRDQLHLAVEELHSLQNEATLLEVNRFTQEREIRRVLGYAASDEVIFDLTHFD